MRNLKLDVHKLQRELMQERQGTAKLQEQLESEQEVRQELEDQLALVKAQQAQEQQVAAAQEQEQREQQDPEQEQRQLEQARLQVCASLPALRAVRCSYLYSGFTSRVGNTSDT